MAEGARVALPYPEVAVVERGTLDEQTEAIAEALPAQPVVVGGCCCAHVGAATGVARRVQRLAVIWIDSHGDLNTHETSPSGNLWGMPFRMLLDGGVVAPSDAALVGARSLDPPEIAFMERAGIDDSIDRALADTDAVYVALDLDVLDPSEVDVLIPERRRGQGQDCGNRRDRLSCDGAQRGARRADAGRVGLLRPRH
jgi:arginase family enzyme